MGPDQCDAVSMQCKKEAVAFMQNCLVLVLVLVPVLVLVRQGH